MDTLLKAIKQELQGKLNFKGVRDQSDIFIGEHENIIPVKAQLPCIGIVEGAETREELAGGLMRYTRQVHLVAWMKLLRGEENIIGDNGLIALSKAIDSQLDENLLGIDGMEHAFIRQKSKPVVFGSDSDAIRQQIITIQYQQTGARP